MNKDIEKLKYWLRIHHIPIDVFGKGETKNNPIKVKTRRKKQWE